eukprot:scaffold3466_cov132-Isochrysis_galbana.AAC.8
MFTYSSLSIRWLATPGARRPDAMYDVDRGRCRLERVPIFSSYACEHAYFYVLYTNVGVGA